MPLVFKINVLGFEAACPAAPWALLSGSVAVLISLLLSPWPGVYFKDTFDISLWSSQA